MLRRALPSALLAAAVLACGAASAAEERGDPFRAPTSAEERVFIENERTKRIVREMVPDIESSIMRSVTARSAEMEVRLLNRIDDVSTEVRSSGPVVTGEDGEVVEGAETEAVAVNAPPEGATFISCVNGKALYRETDGSLFQFAGSVDDRCAQ